MRDPSTWKDTCHKWSCKLQSPKVFVCLCDRESRDAVQDLYLNDLLQLWLLYTGMLCLCPEAQLAVPSEQAPPSMWCGFPTASGPRAIDPLLCTMHVVILPVLCWKIYSRKQVKVPAFHFIVKSDCPWQNTRNILFFYAGNTSPTASPFSSALSHSGAHARISPWCSLCACMLAPQEQWGGWNKGTLALTEGHQYFRRE